jgi:hypothetical protein
VRVGYPGLLAPCRIAIRRRRRDRTVGHPGRAVLGRADLAPASLAEYGERVGVGVAAMLDCGFMSYDEWFRAADVEVDVAGRWSSRQNCVENLDSCDA